ncbi:DUF1015 family protein [Streptomyces hainanensis]|uniref:DUF1015 domain-containing protein n=1 Tax=Streptomyces hainanensis TaxID=402648 RepID=A0A4V2Y380_9ACTN|nr:DUF1015 domain-containing protein [Streptomyces hainanensis]TDC75485.1 DUF1015 domain-containing protein [Streptomyces hainanensis]
MHAAGLDLAPFRALRYAPERVGNLADVISPPYDVVVRPDEQRDLETSDPHNIVRLILPRTPERAAATLHEWLAAGVLRTDRVPALYVYEQRAPGLPLQRGIMGALRLTVPSEGTVLPHEDVIPEVVDERAALLRATRTDLEPLLLAYRGAGDDTVPAVVERATARPPLLATPTDDATEHRIWAVTEPAEIAVVRAELARHRALIADGHHRWATRLRLSAEHGGRPPWDRGLVLLVDTDRHPLRVSPIHRVVAGLPLAEALARAGTAFRVSPVAGPLDAALRVLDDTPGNAFLLARASTDAGTGTGTGTDGAFHLLDRPDPALLTRTVPADRPRAWRELDATVLNAALLGELWRPAAGRPLRVRHLHGAPAAVAQTAGSGDGFAVLMRAVREETVRTLAERGVTMPHKSTSFGPKPATGLLLRDPQDDPRDDPQDEARDRPAGETASGPDCRANLG